MPNASFRNLPKRATRTLSTTCEFPSRAENLVREPGHDIRVLLSEALRPVTRHIRSAVQCVVRSVELEILVYCRESLVFNRARNDLVHHPVGVGNTRRAAGNRADRIKTTVPVPATSKKERSGPIGASRIGCREPHLLETVVSWPNFLPRWSR